MGNRKNLPQHGQPKPSPQFKMLKHFTEKKLRRLVRRVISGGRPISFLAFLFIVAIHATVFYLVRDKKPSN
jgi:hypothetical protein